MPKPKIITFRNKLTLEMEIDSNNIKQVYQIASFLNEQEQRNLQIEEIISKDPYYALRYSRDIIKERFELGEEAISTSPQYSYNYAEFVIKERFELGEEIISKDAGYSYLYAKNIIQGRFELGEEEIRKSAEYCEYYISFLKGIGVSI